MGLDLAEKIMVIGYVRLKRENAECTIRGRICPEHLVKQKDYTVILKIDEKNDKIKSLECLDCAAAAGSTFFESIDFFFFFC